MYILAIRVGFWLMFGYVVFAGRAGKVPISIAALWLVFYAAARVLPGVDTAAIVIHAVLLVALGLWVKVTDAM